MKLKKFFYKIKIFLIKNNWYLSKNKNSYNPTLEATVYKWNDGWNIARHSVHHGNYKSKKEAMDAAFEMWLEDSEKRAL